MKDRINSATGLYNEPLFEVLFNHEIARSKRYPSPITLLHLKICIGEKSSGEIWESASLYVAHVLNSNLRHVDVPAHHGQDFWILLPATDEEGGKVVGKRLIERMNTEQVTRANQNFWMGVCIGLAFHKGGSGISGEELLAQATRALKEATRRGVNSLVCYRDLARIE